MKIYFHRSGGYAGMDEEWQMDTDELISLAQAVASEQSISRPHPDAVKYVVKVDDKELFFEGDAVIPASLRALESYLKHLWTINRK